jgi:hypothetical protein
MSFTRQQSKTLATLRSILRHIRTLDNRPSPDGQRDVTLFTRHVMAEYRAGQRATRGAVALRQRADALAAYFSSVREQHVSPRNVSRISKRDCGASRFHKPLMQALFTRYRGGDPDAPTSVRSAANFVGLQVPRDVPLGRLPAEVSAKYAQRLQRATGEVVAPEEAPSDSASPRAHLVGVANLKAQLYGSAASVAAEAPGRGGAATDSVQR